MMKPHHEGRSRAEELIAVRKIPERIRFLSFRHLTYSGREGIVMLCRFREEIVKSVFRTRMRTGETTMPQGDFFAWDPISGKEVFLGYSDPGNPEELQERYLRFLEELIARKIQWEIPLSDCEERYWNENRRSGQNPGEELTRLREDPLRPLFEQCCEMVRGACLARLSLLQRKPFRLLTASEKTFLANPGFQNRRFTPGALALEALRRWRTGVDASFLWERWKQEECGGRLDDLRLDLVWSGMRPPPNRAERELHCLFVRNFPAKAFLAASDHRRQTFTIHFAVNGLKIWDGWLDFAALECLLREDTPRNLFLPLPGRIGAGLSPGNVSLKWEKESVRLSFERPPQTSPPLPAGCPPEKDFRFEKKDFLWTVSGLLSALEEKEKKEADQLGGVLEVKTMREIVARKAKSWGKDFDAEEFRAFCEERRTRSRLAELLSQLF